MSEAAQQLPPDPMTQTKARMAELAAETAANLAHRQLRSTLKGYLPKVLHPLIPGERGTVAGNAKAAASKWFWGIVSSVVFSLVFFALFAFATVAVLGFIAFAVLGSM